MENLRVKHVEGEPPIYTEMKTVPVSLESCILNSEDDYQYGESQSLEAEHFNEGNLSAEEINTMIMLNEGSNMMSRGRVEVKPKKIKTSRQSGTSLRKSSDIKKILTNDLPAKGRFLSTKSLQRLSGASKLTPKKRRFTEEDEKESLKSKTKQRKERAEIQKNAKNDKLSTLKIKRVKRLDKKAKFETKDHETVKMRRLKELERDSEKKSLNKKSKIIDKKMKDKDISSTQNLIPKMLKKKVLEDYRNRRTSEDKVSEPSKEAETKSSEKVTNSLNVGEPDVRVASRSGRIRKIRVPSDDFVSSMKELKAFTPASVKPSVGQENGLEILNEDTKSNNNNAVAETVAQKSDDKPRALNTELLQDVLSESVESWFDISPELQKKGKRTRRKFKIIPQANASDSEFVEETAKPVEPLESKTKTDDAAIVQDLADSENAGVKEEVREPKLEVSASEKKEDSQNNRNATISVANVEVNEKAEKEKERRGLFHVESMKIIPKKRGRLRGSLKPAENAPSPRLSNVRKLKPNRQITSFSKKRRRVRNMVMLKGLKNYGEKIDFNQKVAPDNENGTVDKEETSNPPSPAAGESGNDTLSPSASDIKPKDLKIPELKVHNILTVSPFKNMPELMKPKKSPLKRSYSFEHFQNKGLDDDSCQQSIEMPADLPSRSGTVKRGQKQLAVSLRKLVLNGKDSETSVPDPKKEDISAADVLSEKKERETIPEEEEKSQVSDECKNGNQRQLRQISPAKKARAIRGRRKKTVEEKAELEVPKISEVVEEKSVGKEEEELQEGNKHPAENPVNAEVEKKSVAENVSLVNVGDEDSAEDKPGPKNMIVIAEKGDGVSDSSAVEQEVVEAVVSAPEKDFSLGSMSKCIPFKKRGMQGRRRQKGRPKGLKRKPFAFRKEEKLGENVPPKEENANPVLDKQKDPPDRRKSYREIKLTPKIVDMIATSTKRPRKFSSIDNRTNCVMRSGVGSGKTETVLTEKDSGYSNLIKRVTASPPEIKSEPEDPSRINTSIENYLQTKMEQNAVNFESSWVPGDLVWARFAGNPFWPSLILRDPFRNEEFSRVKYLGRLPRLFVHVQFLADWGRRAWGPEMYLMNFSGLEHFQKLKANLPVLGSNAARKDVNYHQAFIIPKKLESSWNMAVKEADTLLCKTRDERITYMKIKYPLVKYAASIANGHLVPNVKGVEQKGPVAGRRKGRSSDQWGKENDNVEGDKIFECVNTSKEEDEKANEKASPKITLKIVRSPHRGRKRKNKNLEGADGKLLKRVKKELFDEDYIPSDSGSNGDKGSEVSTFKQKKTQLFRGARVERVCQICLEIMEGEKIMKCKGVCQGLFHMSCANKMNGDSPPATGDGTTPKAKRGRQKRSKKTVDGEGNQNKDIPSEEDWRCNDCIRGENPCFVCKSRTGSRQRCRVVGCGKFYHQKCLKLYPQTIYNQGAPISKLNAQQKKILWDAESPNQQILSCPLHVCHTCASDNPSDTSMKYMYERLVRCVECPSAYHLGNYCVPAGSRILNTSQIICSKHCDADTKKSHVNISWCFICNMGGSLICCDWCPSSFHLDCLNIKPPEDSYICEECESGRFPLHGEVVWVKLGRYRWWPARVLFPQEIPPNIKALSHKPWEFAVRFYGSNDHYWLSRGRVFLYQEGDSEQNFKVYRHVDKVYQKAVQEASRDYFLFQEERKHRREGSVTSATLKPPPYVKIKTNRPVGKVQLGNTSQKEPPTCDCDPNMELPCSPWSDCLNRMLLLECDPNYCNAGTRCGNQCFEKREYPPLEPYWTETRGWGLKSSVDIQRGQFVIEYVGEVVDEEEFKRRMKRKYEAKDNNYYFLTIDKDRIIDAGPKGNLARFMNHSCSPNCETQKWTVNGDTRVGLFALCDIPAGTELTFNYNLDCAGNEKKVCKCEGVNCSGFIGVKAKVNVVDKGEGKGRNLKRSELKQSEDECFVCHDGGELMVCDVRQCPKVYHLECVGLSEWPNETWLCPRHYCSLCNKSTKRCCKVCPNAFCYNHLDTNLFLDINSDLFCSNHVNAAVRSTQQIRKPSYVNRNTPIIEYEKPFAEKYRPPPLSQRRNSSEAAQRENEILMEPNLTDNTPIVVENLLLSSAKVEESSATSSSRLNDGVSVKVFYVDEEGRIVNMDNNAMTTTDEAMAVAPTGNGSLKKVGGRKKKRTNIPRKKIYPHLNKDQIPGNVKTSSSVSGINFESIMIKSVEDKILDSKLNIDNICNIIGGGLSGSSANKTEGGGSEKGSDGTSGNSEKCRDDSKPEGKKDDAEVDRSRRSKYFKIVTPEKIVKNSEANEPNPKTVTDFNYIEFMHPLKSSRSKTKADENGKK